MKSIFGVRWADPGVAAVIAGAVFLSACGEKDGSQSKREASPEQLVSSSGGNSGSGPSLSEDGDSADAPPSKLTREDGPVVDGRPAPPKPLSKYPVSVWIPGKTGFVFNPHNNNPVDARGIPPGTLIRDPQDEDESHLFRLPKIPEEKAAPAVEGVISRAGDGVEDLPAEDE